MATTERLSVRLPADIMAELRAAAASETRTVAQVARLALGRWADERRARRNMPTEQDVEAIREIMKVPDEWTDPGPFEGTPPSQS